MNSKSLQAPIKKKSKRILFQFEKDTNAPTVVFFAGVHGNEKAGVVALKQVYNRLDQKGLKGNVYGVLGNLKALESNQRYIDADLNRLWTKDSIDEILTKEHLHTEEQELKALFKQLEHILSLHTGPLYFIDLHTTSSKTVPFITINDAMINRAFSKLFPVPIVLGIEEYLEGPLLSYINTLGYVSIGFESGQHTDISSVENNIAFIHLALVFAEIIDKDEVDFNMYFEKLRHASENVSRFFEIVHLQRIKSGDTFKMYDGFKSFQPIVKGTPIGRFNGSKIRSKYNGRIFMPLYQNKGSEGFFIIKSIPWFFLKLSRILRRFKADRLLIALMGIYWHDKKKGVLKSNLKITRFLAKPLFHVLGYRSRQITEDYVYLYNRERIAKIELYKNTKWAKDERL
ncbi:succinylglutamate desuccinylase/aspartoacylase family protein [Algibacter sp. 2305UL17-15]|uniref:succinylglutamate desuccinylase/aspartoacylase family protein n=1 Tax=Algibacter sp. 2305UL17-15 TaxID=3231268 RepID=UPI00345972EB